MKYYGLDGLYKVDTLGVGDGGKMQYGVTITDDEGKESNLISIEPSFNKLEVETKLAEYAKKENLMPELIYRIKQGERVLQGTPKTENDFIAVSAERKAEEFDKYLAHKSRIAKLEADLKSKIESLKKDYKEQIEAEEEAMNAIESVARTGTLKEECQASWERDIENGCMLLIRHDNLKVLQWRLMNESEAQVTIEDQETTEE